MCKPMTRYVTFLSTLLLVSCVSGYKEFYRPSPGATPDVIASRRAAPAPEIPLVEHARPGDGKAILDAYGRRGYVMIGQSMFNSGRNEFESSAVAQGKAVGADLVLILDPRYTGSVTTSVPITTPTSQTSYSSGTATAYGAGGSVTAYGSGTTTTYGTSTSYVPITIRRSDYGAVYFIKLRYSLGVSFRDLNEAERQELQSNRGAVVTLVVNDTPAFNADILVGDILRSIDGAPVTDSRNASELLGKDRGKQVKIALTRHGHEIDKLVQLNP